MKHFFKVLSRVDGKLFSLRVHVYPDFAQVVYLPGQWTTPIIPGTPLFLCPTKKIAMSWVHEYQQNEEIWICEARTPRFMSWGEIYSGVKSAAETLLNPVDVYYNREGLGEAWAGFLDFPTDKSSRTVLCSAVKLIQRVA